MQRNRDVQHWLDFCLMFVDNDSIEDQQKGLEADNLRIEHGRIMIP